MNKAVAELTRKVGELSAILEVSKLIGVDLEDDRVLETVLQKAMLVLRAEAGTLWLAVDGGAEARSALGAGAESRLRARVAAGEGSVGRVLATGAGELVADARTDASGLGLTDGALGLVARSAVTAPLPGRNRRIGCLQVFNREDGSLFDEGDLELLCGVGTQAALVIENARHMEELRRLSASAQDAWRGALDALASALATRDYETEAHCQRTVEMTLLLARRLGVPDVRLPSMSRGALLHDIGKIGIPDGILFKAGPLTPVEREVVKQHVVLGYNMLRHIPFFSEAMPVVLHHHESYDGSGFPGGLKGEAIPQGARIFRVADVYDALISERPYKHAWSTDRAIDELRHGAGREYDPDAVDALTNLTKGELAWISGVKDFQPSTRELLGQP